MGASVPAIGGVFKASAMGASARGQERELDDAAVQAEENALIAKSQGNFNALKHQNEAEQIFGAMRVATAASGIEGNSGSALSVLRQSYKNAELDRLSILYDSKLKQLDSENKASIYRRKSDTIAETTKLNQFATLVGAGGDAYKQESE